MSKGDDTASGNDVHGGMTDARRSRSRTARPGAAPIGDALRGVYEVTVGERVPQEMLDLLGKLD